MKLQLLPSSLLPSSRCTPGVCNVGSGSWDRPGGMLCWDALGCTGWRKWGVHFWDPWFPWGFPPLTFSCCIHVAPPPAPPKSFFPSFPCGSLQGIPRRLLTNAKGPLFLGSSRGEQHTGFAHGALAEQGRGRGALSGYNLGTINRGSKGSRFLFSFYPLQCLC